MSTTTITTVGDWLKIKKDGYTTVLKREDIIYPEINAAGQVFLPFQDKKPGGLTGAAMQPATDIIILNGTSHAAGDLTSDELLDLILNQVNVPATTTITNTIAGFATVTVTTATYTIADITVDKLIVLVNYAGTCALTLPDATTNADKEVVVKSITDSSATVATVFTADANTIAANSYGSLTYHSDGTTWYLIAAQAGATV